MQVVHYEHKNSFGTFRRFRSGWRVIGSGGRIEGLAIRPFGSGEWWCMASFPVGLLLRFFGLLIEVVCLILLRRWGGQGRSFAGLPVESWLWAGLGLGFGMWMAWLIWFRRSPTLAPGVRGR